MFAVFYKFCSATCNAAMGLWSIHHDVVGDCLGIPVFSDWFRAYIQRIKDSQTGKPHCQESSLQKKSVNCIDICVMLCKLLCHFVIIHGSCLRSFPSTRMTLASVSTESGRRWKEQVPWQLCIWDHWGISQTGAAKHTHIIYVYILLLYIYI